MTVIDLHTRKEISAPAQSVLCLGNFDGVHLGHRALVYETIAQKRRLSTVYPQIKSGAWFFRRAPYDIITRNTTPKLTDLSQKLDLFAELGLDLAFIFEYEEVGDNSPEKFVNDVLKKDCGCVFAICGYNFKFGKGAKGDTLTLTKLMDGNASIVNKISVDGKNVSSSDIRRLIADGNIEGANLLLGHNFGLHGEIIHGKKLGRTLGIPTVNQSFDRSAALPKNGIYVSQTFVGDAWLPSVSNIGIRPSVEKNGEVNCETYILDFTGDLYGKDLKIELLSRLRDEIKFDGVESLKAQINKDIEQTRLYFEKRREV